MNCSSTREVLPALLDHRTPATAHLEARAHLANCPECQREFSELIQTLAALDGLPATQPSPRLRKNFYAMLEEEKNSAASVLSAAERRRSRGLGSMAALWRWVAAPLAGCALLILGFLGGTRYGPPAPAPANPADDATRRELAVLRDQVNKMGQLVGYSLLQQQQGPANERLRGVLAAARTEDPGPKVLDDLISALAFDPNAAVRLRALEALWEHAENQVVRAGVLASLPREQNPLVQLEMIDFVTAARDVEATPLLEKMSQDEAIDRSVRAAARRALVQM